MRYAAWLLVAGLLLAGCDDAPDYGSLNLVSVTGKVTLDAQPLAGATVRFEGPPGRFSSGATDAAGVYRLMYDSNQAGCTPGEKTVRITKLEVAEGEEGGTIEGADGTVEKPTEPIPAQYNTASTLKAVVSASNKTFDYDLKSKP